MDKELFKYNYKNNVYIYDDKKLHGYVYSEKDNIFHFCDKFSINKLLDRKINSDDYIKIDLRSELDISTDRIPISLDKIFIPSLNIYTPRSCRDLFTYYMPFPIYNEKLQLYMENLIPDKYHLYRFHNFLYTSFINYTPKEYISITGSNSAVNKLYLLLYKLSPLITYGRSSLYCESNVSKSTLLEINKARIVLTDIGERTLRVADPPHNKKYKLPIQHHGIVYQIPINTKKDYINIIDNETQDISNFTSENLLYWIFHQDININ